MSQVRLPGTCRARATGLVRLAPVITHCGVACRAWCGSVLPASLRGQHVLVGDFNALHRGDYTAADWHRVASVRKRGSWEPPRTELMDWLLAPAARGGLGYIDAAATRTKALTSAAAVATGARVRGATVDGGVCEAGRGSAAKAPASPARAHGYTGGQLHAAGNNTPGISGARRPPGGVGCTSTEGKCEAPRPLGGGGADPSAIASTATAPALPAPGGDAGERLPASNNAAGKREVQRPPGGGGGYGCTNTEGKREAPGLLHGGGDASRVAATPVLATSPLCTRAVGGASTSTPGRTSVATSDAGTSTGARVGAGAGAGGGIRAGAAHCRSVDGAGGCAVRSDRAEGGGSDVTYAGRAADGCSSSGTTGGDVRRTSVASTCRYDTRIDYVLVGQRDPGSGAIACGSVGPGLSGGVANSGIDAHTRGEACEVEFVPGSYQVHRTGASDHALVTVQVALVWRT